MRPLKLPAWCFSHWFWREIYPFISNEEANNRLQASVNAEAALIRKSDNTMGKYLSTPGQKNSAGLSKLQPAPSQPESGGQSKFRSSNKPSLTFKPTRALKHDIYVLAFDRPEIINTGNPHGQNLAAAFHCSHFSHLRLRFFITLGQSP